MTIGNRAKVVYDDGTTEYYNIQPVNFWRFHKEFLLLGRYFYGPPKNIMVHP